MRRPLVVGNWKMNGSRESAQSLVQSVGQQLRSESVSAEVGVCPPFVFLESVSESIADLPLALGAQNCSTNDAGAFTGEVSASMLANIGCHYVIIGHSERRELFGETSSQLLEKLKQALANNLQPIFCVGERLEQRESDQTLEVISEQLLPLREISASAGIVVAYEPVWAIGTGKTASPEQAQEVHAHIRSELGSRAQSTRLLYGGSVNAENAQQLFAQLDIDGGLVGGASLKVEDFIQICRAASR